MKHLILKISLIVKALMVFTVFSQTYTIDISKVYELKKMGKHTPLEVIENSPINLGSRIVNCSYVIDINKKTSTFYNKGKFISKLKFDFFEFKDGIYNIFLSDKTLNDQLIITNILLDTNKNDFIFSWYDPFGKYTRTNTHIEKIKKSR